VLIDSFWLGLHVATITYSTCCEKFRSCLKCTPKSFATVTRLTLCIIGGSKSWETLALWKTISTVLSRFNVILFLLAQFMMWVISSSTDVLEFWGDKRVASSAYFMRKFKISSGLGSWAKIIKRVGPIPEPWMIGRFIGSVQERWKPSLGPDYDQ